MGDYDDCREVRTPFGRLDREFVIQDLASARCIEKLRVDPKGTSNPRLERITLQQFNEGGYVNLGDRIAVIKNSPDRNELIQRKADEEPPEGSTHYFIESEYPICTYGATVILQYLKREAQVPVQDLKREAQVPVQE